MAPSGSKALELPVVSYSVLPPEQHDPPNLDATGPQFIQYGYNDAKVWPGYTECNDPVRGGRYMRWIQPLESELAKQVEYDMDDQDKVWLDTLNLERKREALVPIAYEVFEIIMDKLEKEWFDLTKSIPKKSNAVPTENEKCAICDDGECENSNAIVFCDGCNLAVHQDCYGVPYIPEGQWLCRKCTVSPDKAVDCVFCPQPFGAFKQTTTGHWGHLLCAIWIPETGVSNTVYMEPIDGVENVPKSRWKLNCYLCKKKLGACIQCSNRNCYTAYHVTCAREFGLEVRMKQGGGGTGGVGELKSYCDKHGKVQWDQFSQSRAAVPSSTRIPSFANGPPHRPLHSTPSGLPALPLHAGHSAAPSAFPLASTSQQAFPGHPPFPPTGTFPPSLPPPTPAAAAVVPLASSKSLRSKKMHLSPIKQTPVIPQFIFDRVNLYIAKIKGLTGKKDVVSAVCRYWSLKREGRTGAPLLKRIHLEPWTASATSRLQSDSDRASKLELLKLLRTDLERVRMLTEQVKKREKKKLERLRWFKREVLDAFVWPKETRLREALDEIISWDKQQYFLNPIDPLLVPDYHDIISHPMCWSTMSSKLERHEYPTAQSFVDDANLVIANAQKYNKPSSPIHRHSTKVASLLAPLTARLVGELDGPESELSIRESLAPRLLLEEFAFDPDAVEVESEREGEGGAVRDDANNRRATEDKVVIVDELERVWYDVTDPLGDRKQRQAEAEARAERDKVAREQEEREKVEREKRDKVEAERARVAKEDEELEREQKKRREEQERELAAAATAVKTNDHDEAARNEDVDMAPPAASRSSKKRKVAGGDEADKRKKHKKTTEATTKKTDGKQDPKKKPQPLEPATPAVTQTSEGDAVAAEPAAAETVLSNRDTFKLFETGWVLPEGSSRRKPATPVVSTVPLPGPAPPVASTSAARAEPTSPTKPSEPKPSSLPPRRAATAAADNASPAEPAPKSRKGKEKAPIEPPPAADDQPDAEVESKPSAPAALAANYNTALREWQTRWSVLNKIVAIEDEDDDVPAKSKSKSKPQPELVADGTLVWHRSPGNHAWYPAEVADPNGDDMPAVLVKARPKPNRSGGVSDKSIPLLYFDDTRSGAWASKKELRLLGENKEFDELMQTREAVKNWAKTKNWKQCADYVEELNDAYNWAISLQETEGDEGAETGAQAGAEQTDGGEKNKSKSKQKNKRKRKR
ncbi:hypothetical protein JCM11491_001018 [Sporobolomyces phaffii]